MIMMIWQWLLCSSNHTGYDDDGDEDGHEDEHSDDGDGDDGGDDDHHGDFDKCYADHWCSQVQMQRWDGAAASVSVFPMTIWQSQDTLRKLLSIFCPVDKMSRKIISIYTVGVSHWTTIWTWLQAR